MVLVLILIALAGAALLSLGGALLTTANTRRALASSPHAFRCKIAMTTGDRNATVRWPWRPSYAIWVHDSLVVLSGMLRPRVRPLAVHFAEGAVTGGQACTRLGIGPDPVFLSLELDDGTHVILAAPRSARSLVAGPYLAALLTAAPSRSAEQSGS